MRAASGGGHDSTGRRPQLLRPAPPCGGKKGVGCPPWVKRGGRAIASTHEAVRLAKPGLKMLPVGVTCLEVPPVCDILL